ncbi:MAG TPA: tetratricopeptide repeat protein [Terriglobales bacterium]|nr:tetratricopeptide repeat protein [Terriglobales bacterium]
MKRILSLLLLVASLGLFAGAQVSSAESATQSKTLLVLPFENTSKAPGLEWIGESFAEMLADRMASPLIYAIPRQDRVYAFDRFGIPTTVRPSRASLFRIGEQMDADYMVLGSYTFDGQTFTATAQLLDVKRLHISQEITEAGPLVQLFRVQDALSWNLLRLVDPRFSTPREQFLATSPSIRLDAFENYIRGVVATSRQEKIKKLREAIRLNPQYTMAMMQLGKTYFGGREYENAAATFAKVPKEDDEAREANFYAGLSYYYLGDYDRAATAFSFLAERFPLTEVYNNLGVAQARRGRKDALDFFQKAADADPSDADYRFNLAMALYRSGDIAAAVRELRQGLKFRPDDAEAKSLLDQLSATAAAATLPTPAANAIAQSAQPARTRLPLERIKRNYDETGFRQLALEIQNATELRLAKADPEERAAFRLEHGQNLLSHGFAVEATRELREAVELDPVNAQAHAALADALESQNDLAGARSEAEAALKIQALPQAFVVLARLDLRDNRLESAARNVDRALSADPSNAAAIELKRTIAAKLAERTQPLP